MMKLLTALATLGVTANATAQIPTCSAPTTLGQPLSLTISAPLPGSTEVIVEPCCDAAVIVTGNAAVGLPLYDFYFVIDSSGSTSACSGADIDGDLEVGVPGPLGCSDPGDTVLAAEVRAVRDFVVTLTPVTSRVAILQFSNPEGFFGLTERQRIVQSLTDDFALVNLALDEVLGGGSAGATDYAGGLDLVAQENLANGEPLTRRQLSYFLSDGIPTFPESPYNSEEPTDSQLAIDSADALAVTGVRIDTFGVGFLPTVTQDPVLPKRCLVGGVEVSTLECVAARTGGGFFASNDPADIVERLRQSIPELGIDSVTVFNDSLLLSQAATVAVDGAWSASIPVGLGGQNLLRALAIADDGTPCEALTDIEVLCTELLLRQLDLPLPGQPSRPPGSPGSPLSPSSPCAPASPGSPGSPSSPASPVSTTSS